MLPPYPLSRARSSEALAPHELEVLSTGRVEDAGKSGESWEMGERDFPVIVESVRGSERQIGSLYTSSLNSGYHRASS